MSRIYRTKTTDSRETGNNKLTLFQPFLKGKFPCTCLPPVSSVNIFLERRFVPHLSNCDWKMNTKPHFTNHSLLHSAYLAVIGTRENSVQKPMKEFKTKTNEASCYFKATLHFLSFNYGLFRWLSDEILYLNKVWFIYDIIIVADKLFHKNYTCPFSRISATAEAEDLRRLLRDLLGPLLSVWQDTVTFPGNDMTLRLLDHTCFDWI